MSVYETNFHLSLGWQVNTKKDKVISGTDP